MKTIKETRAEDVRAGYAMGYEAGVAHGISLAKEARPKKAWNGGVACGVPIQRTVYHKTLKPTCSKPRAEGSNRCRLHKDREGEQ